MDLQRQQELDAKHREADMPGTPMTTMSMFIPPDLSLFDNEGPAEHSTPTNADPSLKHATGRRKHGQRALADPTATMNAQSAGPPEPSSLSKQSSGFSYIRSKFTSKSKKNKDSELSSQPYTKPASFEYLSGTPGSATLPNMRKIETVPEAVPTTTTEHFPGQNLPSHFSTVTTRTVVTPESRYASLLKNDAMIFGNISMSPTRSGSYAMVGYPAVVTASHPSIMSCEGSIFGASSRDSSTTTNPNIFNAPFVPAGHYDTSYTVPLPPPPGEEFQDQPPFHHQLPFYLQHQPYKHIDQTNRGGQHFDRPNHNVFNSGTWEQLHAQHPATMPQFSPVNPQRLHWDKSDSEAPSQASDNTEEAEELRKQALLNSLYNANATESKSENGKEALEALENEEHAEAEFATPLRGSLRRSASDPELRYSSHQVDSSNRTPVASRSDKPPAKLVESSQMLSPTTPMLRPSAQETFMTMVPTTLKPDRYMGDRPKQLEPVQGVLHSICRNTSSLQGTPTQFDNKESAQGTDTYGNGGFSAQSHGNQTTRGGYPPTPQHPQYQARSSLEEQMTHQFNVMHHHVEAVKHTLSRSIEDAKNFIADTSISQVDEGFIAQFRQLCVQNNGFREYLQRIQLQTTNLRQGIVGEVVPAVSYAIASRFTALEQRMREEQTSRLAAHEQRMREEHKLINKNVLTLNDNVYAIQRHFDKHMAQTNRKMKLLLEAHGFETSKGGQSAPQDRDATQHQLSEEVPRQQGELMGQLAMVEEENEAAAATARAMDSAALSPITQIAIPPTKNRKPTPLPAKMPIMAAVLTSTPPHVPQLPQLQSQSSSFRTVTITDPSIPSPSAVSNARRIRHGHHREDIEARKENNRVGLGVKGLADVKAIQGPGSQFHPALMYQEGIERLSGDKKEQQTAEEKMADTDGSKVLWRKPSGDGEIGGGWYKAAMQE